MPSKKHNFSAIIQAGDKGGAFVNVPFDVEKEMGAKRPKVNVVFDKKAAYQGSLVRMGTACHLLIVRKDIRATLQKEIGDTIHVEVCLDTAPRVVEVPARLKEIFKIEKEAAAFFQTLSYTCQKEYVHYITEAKREATQDRRTLKVIEMLNNKTKTPG